MTPIESPFDITLLIILTVLSGIGAQVFAAFLNAPGIVFLLLFGIMLGPSALGFLNPDRLGAGLEVLVSLLVAIILFEGGFNLQLRDLGRVSGSLRNLVTIGTLITLLGAGMAAHWLSEFPWPIAFLYASLVVVTGPTVINPLLKHVQVDRRVSTLLEGEGVLIDPVGAILAVVVLNVLLNGGAAPLTIAGSLVVRLGLGGGIGVLGGWLLGLILKKAKFISDDIKALVVLAGLWGLYGVAQLIQSESGLMATVAAGIVLRAFSLPEERLLKRFKGQLSILAVSVLFILLSADLSIAGVFALGWGGVLTVLALMFIVRPLNIWVCTWNSGLNWRQKLFLCWVAPRGIVSASVASLFAILLTQRGINGGDSIKALVFLTIIMTVFLQALTAQWIANLLQINSKAATGAVIVGCNPLSLLIARLFKERDEAVVLIDTAPEARERAEQENLPIFISSALDVDVLERAGLASKGTFLAMTSNGEVNLVVAHRAAEEFGPPRVLAIFPRDPQTNANSTNAATKIQQAFLPHTPLKVWNEYLTDASVKLGETVFAKEGLDAKKTRIQTLMDEGDLVPLIVERSGQVQIPSGEVTWQVGDRLFYLLHYPKPKLLKALSGSSQNHLKPEALPEVEKAVEDAIEAEKPEVVPEPPKPAAEPEKPRYTRVPITKQTTDSDATESAPAITPPASNPAETNGLSNTPGPQPTG